MVERQHRASVTTFFAPGEWGAEVVLGEGAAHHAQVKRLAVNDAVFLTSGDGRRAQGVIYALGKRDVHVALDAASLTVTPPFPQVDLYAPIGDRDRMLMLAEKSVELGVSSWSSVMFARSRSVSPRGEGDTFAQKMRQRQISALEQSAGAWLPAIHRDITLDALAAATPYASRLLLDAAGERISDVLTSLSAPVAIALGPEGGFEERERAELIQSGWRPVSLAANVLRFETAAIAALAIVRSHIG